MARFCIDILLLACCLLQACSPVVSDKRVHAQMYVKDTLGKDGVIDCFAEGKHYGIRSVTEQTFYPGDDSFHRMHHHGVALESEQMAYRIYFDKRQTVDVYAKRTPRLELAESLWYPNDEQLAEGFGDDVLKVGNTIGVGSVRPWNRDKRKLQNMDVFASRTQRIRLLTDTCATVETEVVGLETEGKVVNILTRYSINAGHRDMQCEVFCSDSLTSLVTGVQHIGGDGEQKVLQSSLFAIQHGGGSASDQGESVVLVSWGTDWPVNDTVRYPKETLGIAVAVPCIYAGEVIPDSRQTLISLCLLPCSDASDLAAGYLYYAAFRLSVVSQKELNPPALTAEQFFNLF